MKFEELKAHLVQLNMDCPEEYIIRCFIGGLKENLKSTVKMLRPHTLNQVVILAKHQENTSSQVQHDIDTSLKHSASQVRSQRVAYTKRPPQRVAYSDIPLRVQTPTAKTIRLKRLSPAEMVYALIVTKNSLRDISPNTYF